MPSTILGYSERGLIYSLFYEMSQKEHSVSLMNALLNQAYYWNNGPVFKVDKATILIEHSLSDFGDADVVLLLEEGRKRMTVFIEAKVKTWQRPRWSMSVEFDSFLSEVNTGAADSSNIFVQLYSKHRLVQALCATEIGQLRTMAVRFPDWSRKKSPRKLGKNNVVLRTAELIKGYLDEVYYIGIVPEGQDAIRSFMKNKLEKFEGQCSPEWRWETKNWGWLSWPAINRFCEKAGLEVTLSTFKHNEGQVY